MQQREEPEEQGWGWWTVYTRIQDFETELETIVPNPRSYRLLAIGEEYTIEQLGALLQNYGSYLSTLHSYKGIIKGQTHGLKQSFSEGLKVAMAQLGGGGTNASKEGQVMAENETLGLAKKMQIEQEAVFEVVDGWIDSYQIAWDTISRLITIHMGEVALQTNRSV